MIFLQIILANVATISLLLLIYKINKKKQELKINGLEKVVSDAVDRRLASTIDESLWPQIESLTSLYRVLDGKEYLPRTRRWAASPDFLLYLSEHILKEKPSKIIECGGGSSTVIMAISLKQAGNGGHIWTIENHPLFAGKLVSELERRGLNDYVTVISAPLSDKRYEGFDHPFKWYTFDENELPDDADLLVVDGPVGTLNPFARFPAGPELLPRLSKSASIILDDASRKDEQGLGKLWRSIYPDLGVRTVRAEKGIVEMFFLDHKIKAFLNAPKDKGLRSE